MRKIFVFVVCWILAGTAWAQNNLPPYVAGVQRLTYSVAGIDLAVRVFYPTTQPSQITDFGPWRIDVAHKAKIATGPHPIILVSHGLGGNDWNHHLLATELAKRGFVVAAVRHPDDLKRVGSDAILVLRPLEVSAALDLILAHPSLGPQVDATRVGVFGFSQGGLTALRLMGAEASQATLIDHCRTNGSADDEFCTGRSAGIWRRLGILVQKLWYSPPEFDASKPVADPRITVGVVAAPVGAPITDLVSVTAPMLLMRAADDTVLRAPFHVEAIHAALPIEHQYDVLEGVGHYSFLSPFPQAIAKSVGLAAQDPPGFDRSGFLKGVNQRIAEFFEIHLLPR